MKKSLNLILLFALTFVFVFTSCNEEQLLPEDDAQGFGSVTVLGNGGQFLVSSDLSLSGVILLKGLVRVVNNATITFAPGSIIRGAKGPSGGVPGTLIIERGSKIIADGTPTQPIVFTSDRPAGGSRLPGDWGGLVILGRDYSNVKAGVNGAPSNYVGAIEGIPDQFAPALYGNAAGSKTGFENESSGIIRFVRIEYAGNVLTEGNETNGLTLGGVGAGTIIENVQVSYGADDAIEWFGGSVNAKYLLVYRNVDDDFDTDQGYDGCVQFAQAIKDPALSATGSSASRGFESNGDNGDAVDQDCLTDATFANVTLYGPNNPLSANCFTVVPNTDYGVVLRDGSKLDLYNSKILAFPIWQYAWESTDGVIVPAEADARGIKAVSANIPTSGGAGAGAGLGVNVTGFWEGLGNDFIRAQGCFSSPTNAAAQAGQDRAAFLLPFTGAQKPNYKATDGFSELVVQKTDYESFNKDFFVQTNYIGAFGPQDSDNSGWHINDPWVEFTPADNNYDN